MPGTAEAHVRVRGAIRGAGGFAMRPGALLFQENQAEDGSLLCTLSETRAHEFVLHVEVVPPAEVHPEVTRDPSQAETGPLWVEYAITEQDADQVVTVTREGQSVALAGCLALHPDLKQPGRYTAQVSLGYRILLPPACDLRAYLVPGLAAEEDREDGNQRPAAHLPGPGSV